MNDPATRRPEVLIVGAGPTGLTAALELTRRGHSVRVIEKNLQRSSFSKALAITAATLKTLTPCEATPRLIEAGRKVGGATLYRESRLLGRISFSELAEPWNFIVVLPQSETEDILEDRLADLGTKVERGVEWIDLREEENEDGVVVTVRDAEGRETEIAADHLLAADGARSGIRKKLALDFPGHSEAQKWQLADVRATLPIKADGPTISVGDDHLLFMICIRNGLYRIVSNADGPQAYLPAGSEVHEVVWQSDFSIHHRQVDSYRVGRIFLAGDAAHIHSPIGGRGMNLGIEDAAEFARLLDEQKLDDYQPIRHRKGKEIVATVSTMTRFLSSPDLLPRLFRRLLLPILLRLPFITRRMARRMVDV